METRGSLPCSNCEALYNISQQAVFMVRIRTEILIKIGKEPVPMAELSEARIVFGRSKTGIVGSNPTRGMDVCPRFSVLCCPV